MDLLGNEISIDEIKSVPDDCEFALESILAEFSQPESRDSDAEAAEPLAPSRPIVMDEEAEGVLSSELSSRYDSGSAPEPAPTYDEPPVDDPQNDDVRIYHIGTAARKHAPPASSEEPPEAEAAGHAVPGNSAGETGAADHAAFGDFAAEFAFAGAGAGAISPPIELPATGADEIGSPDAPPPPAPVRRSFGEALAAPFLSILALVALKKGQRANAAAVPDEAEEDAGPELDAESASKYYAGNAKSLRLRMRISIFLSIILVWFSFGLPVAGILKTNPTAMALVCLILELTVVMLGLDIFTAGMLSLIQMKPSLWSLVSVSCLTAALDAAVTAAMNGAVAGLPLCGVAAVSMTFALAGANQTCRGFRLSLRAVALSRSPFAVTSESGVADSGQTLLKSRRGAAGYLRRCEEPDFTETAYRTVALLLLGACLLLSLIAAAFSKEWKYFFRTLAVITAPCAPFAAFFAFSLPYSIITRRIFHSGSAIAGWPGLRDIGNAHHLIITDGDIFPPQTLSIESVRILEGTWPEKVISCAGSVICASGSGLAPIFTDLMRRNNCSIQRVEEFCCHEGGGLTALINGEEVLCGSAGFMHLMGIRLPQKLTSKSSVFVSINGALTGIFTIKYIPVTSVQDALASLLHTRREPIFAIRDFNITPLMIRKKFRMPTDGFDFPTFARRYEISAAEPSPDSQISAILSRDGLGPLVEVSELGRRLYIVVKLSAILSLICTFIGVVLMFSLCLSASFDSATAGNLLTYLFLWLVPGIVLSLGLGR
ncbi:MAG TPA: hypothetical protein DD735_06975 [Clostridiales bacterium]|nr:hypothetical protein [Clostridiales bacterium]